jgi:hypothetical protein
MASMKILTVISYGDKAGESYRVTLNPYNISMVTSPEALVEKQEMHLCKAIVKFTEEGGAELYITRDDLRVLEEAVGFYGSDD